MQLGEASAQVSAQLMGPRLPAYFITVAVRPATGSTSGGVDLAQYAYDTSKETVKLGIYFDETYECLKCTKLNEDRAVWAEYSSGERRYVTQVDRRGFEAVKYVHVWGTPMIASFFHRDCHDGLAVGRIEVPRGLADEHPVHIHPLTGELLPDGSRELVVSVGILKSVLRYIVWEMHNNSRREDIPTTELGWKDRAQEATGDWDYKRHIRNIWGDFIRVGNYAVGVDSGAFSNYHLGYVAAAGGNSLNSMLFISTVAQLVSTRSLDPEEDKYAIRAGHQKFVDINGELVYENTWLPVVVPFPTTVYATGTMAAAGPIHQTIERDVTRVELEPFVTYYQDHWNAIGCPCARRSSAW